MHGFSLIFPKKVVFTSDLYFHKSQVGQIQDLTLNNWAALNWCCEFLWKPHHWQIFRKYEVILIYVKHINDGSKLSVLCLFTVAVLVTRKDCVKEYSRCHPGLHPNNKHFGVTRFTSHSVHWLTMSLQHSFSPTFYSWKKFKWNLMGSFGV